MLLYLSNVKKIIAKLMKIRVVQVVFVIAIYLVLAPYLNNLSNQIFYTISFILKDILVWLMPIIVFAFIASTIMHYNKKAPIFIGTILIFEACSNFMSIWYAYFVAMLTVNIVPNINAPQELIEGLKPLWQIPLQKPDWYGVDKGSLLGLVFGCISAIIQNRSMMLYLEKSKAASEFILLKIFAPLIPIFVLGFVANIYVTKIFDKMIVNYSILIICLISFLVVYLVFLFLLSAKFEYRNFVLHITNLLPAGLLALTSGCSMSTMPWTIKGTEKNLQNPDFAKAVIPATTNIQQIGDCIVNGFLCYVIYLNFNNVAPSLATWMQFSLVFVVARYATAAMLGGAIFLMLPIYAKYLGFTGEMIAIILALNVVLDPIVTSSNVMANGALCRVFEIIYSRVNCLFEKKAKLK